MSKGNREYSIKSGLFKVSKTFSFEMMNLCFLKIVNLSCACLVKIIIAWTEKFYFTGQTVPDGGIVVDLITPVESIHQYPELSDNFTPMAYFWAASLQINPVPPLSSIYVREVFNSVDKQNPE